MAMTKYYAGLPSLDKEQQKVMPPVYGVLLDQGMIFAYFKDLAPYVDLPGELLDKEIVEYRGARRAVRCSWSVFFPMRRSSMRKS